MCGLGRAGLPRIRNMLVWAAVPVPRSTLIGDLNWPPPNKVGADHQYNHVFKHRVLKSL
jgi:hypothetical protein